MGEPESASARLQCGGSTLIQFQVSGGRQNLQQLGQDINQFLTDLIAKQPQTKDTSANQDKDGVADDSDSEDDEEANDPDIKRMKMS